MLKRLSRLSETRRLILSCNLSFSRNNFPRLPPSQPYVTKDVVCKSVAFARNSNKWGGVDRRLFYYLRKIRVGFAALHPGARGEGRKTKKSPTRGPGKSESWHVKPSRRRLIGNWWLKRRKGTGSRKFPACETAPSVLKAISSGPCRCIFSRFRLTALLATRDKDFFVFERKIFSSFYFLEIAARTYCNFCTIHQTLCVFSSFLSLPPSNAERSVFDSIIDKKAANFIISAFAHLWLHNLPIKHYHDDGTVIGNVRL